MGPRATVTVQEPTLQSPAPRLFQAWLHLRYWRHCQGELANMLNLRTTVNPWASVLQTLAQRLFHRYLHINQYLCTTITGDLASWIQHHDWSPWPGQHHWRQGDQEVCRRLEHQRLQQSSSHCRHLQPWPLRILVIFTDANVSWQLHVNYVTGLFTESELPHTPHLAPLYLPTSEGLSPPKPLWKVWKTSDFRLHQTCIYQFKDTRNMKNQENMTLTKEQNTFQ